MLAVGQKAPAFTGVNQNGKTITLSEYLGKKVILYFYPKDNTPGCTAQSCNLRDNYQELIKRGFVVLGVSADNEKSHKKFIEKYELPFDLIADTDQSICTMYGVWVEKNMYGRKYMGIARTTFVINEQGFLTEVIEKVNTKEHTTQIL